MIWFGLLGLAVIVCFSFVLLSGAPYLPTMTPQVQAALSLADLRPGDTLLELGCGDGKVVLAAARQGIRVVGYELNPLLAAVAWLRTRRQRRLVRIVWGDFWRAEWPPADALFVFLLPRYMARLDHRVTASAAKPVKLVSFAFKIPGRRIDREREGVFLYRYK